MLGRDVVEGDGRDRDGMEGKGRISTAPSFIYFSSSPIPRSLVYSVHPAFSSSPFEHPYFRFLYSFVSLRLVYTFA